VSRFSAAFVPRSVPFLRRSPSLLSLSPHLHTHVVVANLGRGPEGRWSALDGRGLYAHASATDALYHAHLRYELTRRLGVAWEHPDRGRADIAGIAPEARREFSRRSAQIAEHLAERELTSGRARTVAGFATRADKDPLLGADELRPGWEDRARAVGLGPRSLDAVLDRAPRRSPVSMAPAPEDGRLPTAVVEALDDLRRPVTRRDVVRAWCRALPGGAPARSVEDAADRLLEDLTPQTGHAAAPRPGVAERRHDVRSRGPDRDPDGHRRTTGGPTGIEGAELSALLAGRGIGLDRSGHRPDVGFGLG